MTNTKPRLLIALLGAAAVATMAWPARAADPTEDECLAASGDWIKLREAGKLRDARSKLVTCAASSCPGIVREECTRRLEDVNAAIPSVVLEVKEQSGAFVGDVNVTMDGSPLVARLDGKAIPLDPGAHTFVFTAGDRSVEQRVLVKEGLKSVLVSVTLPAKAPATVAPPPPPHDDAPVTVTPTASGSTLKTTGYVLGGVGLAGLAFGGVMGIVAMSQNSDAGCDKDSYCDKPQSRKDAQGSATLSTVGFIAGGVLTAGGVALVLFAPKGEPTATAWHASPFTLVGGGGASLGRAF